jgi:tetratricopeptide (TPR) repeat protein
MTPALASNFSLTRQVLLTMLLLTSALAGCSRGPRGEEGPFIPSTDQEVLERVPARAADPGAREREALRQRLDTAPQDLELALKLAQAHIQEGRAKGDPRYLGRAQAALSTWWAQESPPLEVRVLRATILQSRHEFLAALADLDAVVREAPGHAQAWLTRAVVLSVRGEYAEAARSCAPLGGLAGELTRAVCLAQVQSTAGRSKQAFADLSKALAAAQGGIAPTEQAWALSVLGEAAARAGDVPEGERLLKQALALDPQDAYTRGALADLLIDAGRTREAVELVRAYPEDDALLLRRVLAEKALGTAEAGAHADTLRARYEASHLRGDSLHAREEARFALGVDQDATRALSLAEANWQVQHEPWDARVLLEAALAAGRPQAARPVVDFLQANGAEDPGLVGLAQRVRSALP